MKARTTLGASIGIALAAAALVAGAQTTAGGATQPAPAAAAAPAAPASKPAAAKPMHHKPVHHVSQKTKHHAASGSATSARDGEYHAALKSCVSGPASQREDCLDSAIARYGRS